MRPSTCSRLLAILVLMLLVSAVGISQAPQPALNFSGKWDLDGSKSVPNVVGQGELEIRHQSPEIRITATWEASDVSLVQELIYYSDRRGETNEGFHGLNVKSRTEEKNSELIIKAVSQSVSQYDLEKTKALSGSLVWLPLVAADITERWRLADSGQSLIITRSIKPIRVGNVVVVLSPAKTTYVYKRSNAGNSAKTSQHLHLLQKENPK